MNRREFLLRSGSVVAASSAPGTVARPGDASSAGWICVTYGTQYPPSRGPLKTCAICEDSRQYVDWQGQRWTTLDTLTFVHRNSVQEEEAHLFSIHTEPDFGIGEREFLLQTPEGNVLWDCIALLNEETRKRVQALGGVRAIAISHPHYYTTMVEWSRAFGDAPIFLHELDREWVMRSDGNICFWKGETRKRSARLLSTVSMEPFRGERPIGTRRRLWSAPQRDISKPSADRPIFRR